MKPTYVGLDYLDWSSHGGRHLTAHLTFDKRNRVELERPITRAEAKDLYPDHSDRFYYLPLAQNTNRFEDWDSLVRAATQWCKANLGDYVLLKHDRGDLRKVLAYRGVSETRVRVLNLIEEQWDKLTNPERDSDTMDRFYAAWRVWRP